jgi:hypothetical protein
MCFATTRMPAVGIGPLDFRDGAGKSDGLIRTLFGAERVVREQKGCRQEHSQSDTSRHHLPTRWGSLFSFSEQMNSIKSVLGMICWCTLTVKGFV